MINIIMIYTALIYKNDFMDIVDGVIPSNIAVIVLHHTDGGSIG